jgi:N-acetylglucosaminyl-diphospho-decaprenol L-rhamnosyltransferase
MTASSSTEARPAPTASVTSARAEPSSRQVSPILSVIVVNFRQWRNTARLVRQLRDSAASPAGAAEIVIVDNHSPYHSIRQKLRRTPGVSLRCLRQNRGFARGVNEGCRLSRGRWFLLLNPDVTGAPALLDRALAQIDGIERDLPGAGIVGLQLRHTDGTLQGSVGNMPTFLGTLLGLLRPRAERKCRPLPVRSRRKAQWVTGCGMLIRRDCFEAIGGFDPRYFLYYEDADLCRRARTAGWTVWHDPALQVIHHHPSHSRTVSRRTHLLARHALLTFARQHWSLWLAQLLTLVVWLEAAVMGRRPLRRMASDMLQGRYRRAYRRAYQTAQMSRSREGLRIEAQDMRGRERHERRLLPR